jgi:GT2 family glycosyltransferase
MTKANLDDDSRIRELHQTVADRDEQLVAAYQLIAKLKRDVQSMDINGEHVREMERYLRSVHGSLSWRLTRPLRGIKYLLLWLRDRLTCHTDNGFGSSPKTYDNWVKRYDTPSSSDLARLREGVGAFNFRPVVSVVMPTYNSRLEWLQQAVASVQAQVYPHWELCIADDASPNPDIAPYLRSLAASDPRIKVVVRTENGHISAATNSALDLASGEWVAFLDHDDELSPHALFYMVEALNRHPDAQLLYSDEDKLDEHGQRFDPYFKTDWNPDLFYSHNLVTHLALYPRVLVQALGGLRDAYAGAQDYDLVLRVIERVKPEQVVHVPFVLYHWRAHTESTASVDLGAKPYAMLAGERALNDHFRRLRVSARALYMGYGYRAKYAIPSPAPMVSIIVPTRNALELVRVCVESLYERTNYPHFELLLIDNGSDDTAALAYFAEQARLRSNFRVLRDDGPFSFSALNNRAVHQAKGEVLVFLNNDIEVIHADWLQEMVSHAMRPGVGAVGAKLLYPNKLIQHAGIVLGIGGWAGHAHKTKSRFAAGYAGRAALISNFSAVTGACLAVKKDSFVSVGGFDEVHLKVACNDVDLCLKLGEQGFHCVFTPYAELVHHESATRGYEDTEEKRQRFASELAYMQKRWPSPLAADPAYNPNLTLDNEGFGLAWPPRVKHLWSK